MSKAILIVDMPERCSMCEFIKKTDEGYCYCWRSGFEFSVNDYMKSTPIGKPDWCPLKKIPDKVEIKHDFPTTKYYHVRGWNACIDSILTGCGDDWYA